MKSPVTSITDEQLAEIERFLSFGGSTLKIHAGPLRGLIARLRAAEADAKRMGTALSQIMAQVDGNIRPTVRDIINGMPDANYIYDYCDQIDRIALEAMERKA
jgi:hypothetical protein